MMNEGRMPTSSNQGLQMEFPVRTVAHAFYICLNIS